ncbi:peptidase family C54 [Ancylostoma ceylanicum]|uniref:Cysteine protease n=1 Tax=Ancylostoma ceylanicum TaxID=53326 RepID=A0A0D6L4G1_9BILA|nr:peptidase family C54 [Ancylostoma ceylanicum]
MTQHQRLKEALLWPRPPPAAISREEKDVNESYMTLVNESTTSDDQKCEWRPLLLLVPLRLGLTTINRCYLPAIESFFKLESCVGIIGGRPNHALYFIGIAGDRVDPSLALAFFCESAEAFDKLSRDLQKDVFPSSKPALFEQLETRPKYWPPFEPYTGVKAKIEMKESKSREMSIEQEEEKSAQHGHRVRRYVCAKLRD